MRRVAVVLLTALLGAAGFTPAAPSAARATETLPARPGSLKFAVIGDTGTGEKPEYDVGQRMAAARTAFPFDMNGIQVLRELRKDPALADVPVVALTASVMTRERAAAHAAGFTELLPKPFFPEDLATAITRIVAASRRAASSHDGLRDARGVVTQPPGAAPSHAPTVSAESPR